MLDFSSRCYLEKAELHTHEAEAGVEHRGAPVSSARLPGQCHEVPIILGCSVAFKHPSLILLVTFAVHVRTSSIILVLTTGIPILHP